eukprot:11327702-Karenia_brevis.AAC.1
MSAPPPVARPCANPALANQPATVVAWRPPSAKVAAMRQRSADAREALRRRVDEIGSSMTGRSYGASGSERLHELRER